MAITQVEEDIFVAAGLDEGLLQFSLSYLLYMVNPYIYKKCQCRITARPRTSTQADFFTFHRAVHGGAVAGLGPMADAEHWGAITLGR